jgi:transcriptional regulator with XRE-family HTH domain
LLTEFGRYIKTLRVNQGDITQEDLAGKLGCSASQLSNIMNGKTPPDINLLVKCQKYFGLDKNATVDCFRKAFLSAEILNIDTSYLEKDRKEFLANAIVVLLLYQKSDYELDPDFNMIRDHFIDMYRILKTEGRIRDLGAPEKAKRPPLIAPGRNTDDSSLQDNGNWD